MSVSPGGWLAPDEVVALVSAAEEGRPPGALTLAWTTALAKLRSCVHGARLEALPSPAEEEHRRRADRAGDLLAFLHPHVRLSSVPPREGEPRASRAQPSLWVAECLDAGGRRLEVYEVGLGEPRQMAEREARERGMRLGEAVDLELG